jgi:hypothetical protein
MTPTRAPLLSLAISRVAMASFVLAFGGTACGGEGVPAPVTVGPSDDDVCPAADDSLTSAKAQLDAGAFDPLREPIEDILVDGDGLATTLNLATLVLPGLDDVVATTLLAALTDDETGATITALKPHIVNILEYLHGSSPFIPGAHLEPMTAAHDVVVNCDPVDNIRLVRDLLVLEVRRAPVGSAQAWELAEPGTGEQSFLGALVESLDRGRQIASFQSLLERIAITPDGEAPEGSGDIVVGREAFIVLAKLLAANLAAPDFELAPVRGLLDQVFVPLLDGDAAAEVLLDETLDLLGLVVDQQSETFFSVQAFMGCVDRHDSEAAVPGMLFDYLTVEEFSVEVLLADVAGAARKDQSAQLRVAIVALLDALIAQPEALGDVSGVLGRFLAPEVSPILLDVLVGLKGTGVLTDLTDFVAVVLSCRELAP